MSYVVLALPRSRTAWLSRFLSYREWSCGHEELRHMRSLDDVKSWLEQPYTGTVETAAASSWRLLPKLAPNAKIVLIRRSVKEVIESLMSISGVTFDCTSLTEGMIALDRKLDQIEARLPCLSVDYADLQDERACASIFEYCLPFQHDHEHWARWAPINVQMDMLAAVKYIAAFRPQMDKLAEIAKHRMKCDLLSRRPVVSDGMTLQVESFNTWLQDATHLFEEHLVQVGEAPSNWSAKNLPLMRALDEMGMMQIMTARSNGRMFGYLMTLISPSLADPKQMIGTNTTFFASPDTPGLGLKLQRATLAALKERGVGEVFMQAATRGSGPRLGTLFKRLGAQDDGQVYRLSLSEAA